jgi:hypothetical protein
VGDSVSNDDPLHRSMFAKNVEALICVNFLGLRDRFSASTDFISAGMVSEMSITS